MDTIQRLEESDYLHLYPLFSPQEIKQEFGRRSKSPRSIQRLYSNLGFPPQREALLDLVNRSITFADTKMTEASWFAWVWFHIAERREKYKQMIWNKLDYLESYRETFY